MDSGLPAFVIHTDGIAEILIIVTHNAKDGDLHDIVQLEVVVHFPPAFTSPPKRQRRGNRFRFVVQQHMFRHFLHPPAATMALAREIEIHQADEITVGEFIGVDVQPEEIADGHTEMTAVVEVEEGKGVVVTVIIKTPEGTSHVLVLLEGASLSLYRL